MTEAEERNLVGNILITDAIYRHIKQALDAADSDILEYYIQESKKYHFVLDERVVETLRAVRKAAGDLDATLKEMRRILEEQQRERLFGGEDIG